MSGDHLFEEFPPVQTREWEQRIREDLRGADYKEKLCWQTGEGFAVLPFYRQEDIKDHAASLAIRENGWEVRQPIREHNIEKANDIARRAVATGADGLSFYLSIDFPHNRLRGLNLQSQNEFNKLLENIDLSQTRLHFDAGMISPVLLGMLDNYDSSDVTGTVLYDPLAFFLSNGKLLRDETEAAAKTARMVSFCEKRLPNVKCLGVDGRMFLESGGTIIQQLGYALATASEYLATLSETGLRVKSIASAIHFNFAIGANYFLEIAKFRAARKLWQKLLNAYEVDEPDPMYIHGSTPGWNKTRFDPYVNMLRTTTEGMSAAVAGCDAITIHPFDDPLRPANDFSRRIARNSQLIMEEEAHLNKVGDPAAGSYYVETLTDKIAESAWRCFCEVEGRGGMLETIRHGYIQSRLEESRRRRDRNIATRDRVLVGTNQYPNAHDEPIKNEPLAAEASLQQSGQNARIESANFIPSIQENLKNGCKLGDLIPALFKPPGENVISLQVLRGARLFERLRLATEAHDSPPMVLTLPLRDKKMRQLRSTFAANFFGCAGYEINNPVGFNSIDDAMAAINTQKPDIVVLCSSNTAYKQLVPELCNQIEGTEQQAIVVLAGYPEGQITSYKKAGIDSFIHAKCNVLETLMDFQKRLGITEN